jgi:ATP-dependent Zn protease
MRKTIKHLTFWMVAALVIFLFWRVSSRIQKNERVLSFSEFMAQLERGHVTRVTITATGAGSNIVGQFENGQSIRTFAPPQMENLVNVLLDKSVEVNARDANSASWIGHLIAWTPIVIMIAFLIFFMRSMTGSGAARETERRELRLEMKARFLHALSVAAGELSEDEMMSVLSTSDIAKVDSIEARKALYQMLSDGTVVVTDEKKFRLRTTT